MDSTHFDSLADALLDSLLRQLDVLEDVDAELSQGVLTIDFPNLSDNIPYVVNSHRAAGQIWMAAERTAWHFTPSAEGRWESDKPPFHELPTVLSTTFSNKLGRPIQFHLTV